MEIKIWWARLFNLKHRTSPSHSPAGYWLQSAISNQRSHLLTTTTYRIAAWQGKEMAGMQSFQPPANETPQPLQKSQMQCDPTYGLPPECFVRLTHPTRPAGRGCGVCWARYALSVGRCAVLSRWRPEVLHFPLRALAANTTRLPAAVQLLSILLLFVPNISSFRSTDAA